MTAHNVRGLLYAILIGAFMAAGVLLAPAVKADSQQDYTYINLLQSEGYTVTSPQKAINVAYLICGELATGRDWRLVLADLMVAGDTDLDTATTIFAASVAVYCPQYAPTESELA